MENQLEIRNYYIPSVLRRSEFEWFDGDNFVTFNIIDIYADRITVAITNEGKISVCEFDLKLDGRRFFFEYGVMQKQIAVDDFEQVKDN